MGPERIIIQVNDDKGRHRTKIFFANNGRHGRYDAGRIAGYVQACLDHGLKVTWIEGGEV